MGGFFQPVSKNNGKNKNLEVFGSQESKERKEHEVRLHEQSFEKTPGTESLKTFEGNKDFPLYDKIKSSFVDLKMSTLKREEVINLTNNLGYKLSLNPGDEKLNTPKINKKFVILSIVDVVNTLNMEEKEQSSLRDNLIGVGDFKETNDDDLHFTQNVDDPDYPLLRGLEKNKDLKLTEVETFAIGEQLLSTETIIEAIEAVGEDLINSTRKQEIISKINDIHKELNKQKVGLPEIFGTFPSLSVEEGKKDNVISLIGDNYSKISGGDGRDDINTAINISLNKILYKKVIPNRYSELMQKNISIIRESNNNIKEKVSSLKVIFYSVNGVMGFSGKSMAKVKEQMDKNIAAQEENLEEMYKNVLNLLKKHSENENNRLRKEQESAANAGIYEEEDSKKGEEDLELLLAELTESSGDTKS
ncbi:hypothetical protein CSB08_00395 [Candidatus Gracilibacteria bacterium]|nr:MAG: hypothetical protein CSB08_00395 [Candidatus Gracilibacteria bacterium]PIE85302.1 MAG: hypothetical protein CSA08_02745 [Candidatus Gracilibacteria bacterium]